MSRVLRLHRQTGGLCTLLGRSLVGWEWGRGRKHGGLRISTRIMLYVLLAHRACFFSCARVTSSFPVLHNLSRQVGRSDENKRHNSPIRDEVSEQRTSPCSYVLALGKLCQEQPSLPCPASSYTPKITIGNAHAIKPADGRPHPKPINPRRETRRSNLPIPPLPRLSSVRRTGVRSHRHEHHHRRPTYHQRRSQHGQRSRHGEHGSLQRRTQSVSRDRQYPHHARLSS